MIVNDPRDDELGDVPFRWIRAPEAEAARVRRMRAIAALVLVAASLSAGVLIGRLSTSLPTAARQDQSASLKSAVPSQATTAPEQSSAPTESPQSVASPPTMALTSEPALAVKTAPSHESSVSPESGSPVVVLNPGTAERTRQQDAQPAPGPTISNAPATGSDFAMREKQASPNRRESSNVGSERDYQALRNYMLGR